jgi:hypothetical protein
VAEHLQIVIRKDPVFGTSRVRHLRLARLRHQVGPEMFVLLNDPAGRQSVKNVMRAVNSEWQSVKNNCQCIIVFTES